MPRLIIVFALLAFVGLNGWAFEPRQSSTIQSVDAQLSHLPTDLKLKDDEPQKYKITFDYLYLDTLGNPTGKERVTGEYIRALPDGKVRWNNVRIAKAKSFDQPFPDGEVQTYMEGFTYDFAKRADMLKKGFF